MSEKFDIITVKCSFSFYADPRNFLINVFPSSLSLLFFRSLLRKESWKKKLSLKRGSGKPFTDLYITKSILLNVTLGLVIELDGN